jgi:hypothetical protein
MSQWTKPFKPVDLALPNDPEWLTAIDQSSQKIQDLPKPLRERLKTAMQWMDVAARTGSWRISIPAMFTAVECILVPETCLDKAEVVTVRSAILESIVSGGFFDPATTYLGYLERCYLIHGGPHLEDVLGNGGKLAHDVQYWAIEVILDFIQYAAESRAQSINEIMRNLREHELAEQVCTHIADGYQGGSEVVDKYRKSVGG